MITPLTRLRKFTPVVLGLALCWTTLGCQSNTYQVPGQQRVNTVSTQARLANGKYPLKQATYNDANGQYTLFLFNATPPVFSTTNLQMMPLTAAETQAGEQSYLQMQNNQAILHLNPDFQIEYIHAVTEQINGAETVIVREESTYWEPFEDDDELEIELEFHNYGPHYYVPPRYQRGVVLSRGYHAPTYQEAVTKYEQNYKTKPPAVKNNQLRTSGQLRKSTTTKAQPTTTNKSTTTTTTNKSTTTTTQPTTTNKSTTTTTTNKSTTTTTAPSSSSTKATGSGYGSSNLKKPSHTKPKSTTKKKSSSSFGSSKSSTRKSSGSRKRR